jgi:hypothetical protein
VDTFKGLAIGDLNSSDEGFRLAELDSRLSLLTLSAATIKSSAVYAGEFCNKDDKGRSWLVGSVESAY